MFLETTHHACMLGVTKPKLPFQENIIWLGIYIYLKLKTLRYGHKSYLYKWSLLGFSSVLGFTRRTKCSLSFLFFILISLEFFYIALYRSSIFFFKVWVPDLSFSCRFASCFQFRSFLGARFWNTNFCSSLIDSGISLSQAYLCFEIDWLLFLFKAWVHIYASSVRCMLLVWSDALFFVGIQNIGWSVLLILLLGWFSSCWFC